VDATSLVPGQAANFAASLPATTNSPFMSRPRYSWPHSPITGLRVMRLRRDMKKISRYFIPSRSQPICMSAGGSDGGRSGDRTEVPVRGERHCQSQGPGCGGLRVPGRRPISAFARSISIRRTKTFGTKGSLCESGRSGKAMFRPSSGLRPHASKETNGKRKPAGPNSI
jgi:hypothetical protein